MAAHVVGREMTAMIDSFFAGRTREAAQWNGRLVPLYDALFRVSNPIPVKAAMDLLGLAGGRPRPPLCVAPDTVVAELRREMERLKVKALAAEGGAV